MGTSHLYWILTGPSFAVYYLKDRLVYVESPLHIGQMYTKETSLYLCREGFLFLPCNN